MKALASKIDLENRENFAIVFLSVLAVALSLLVYYGEALTAGRSGGVMTFFGHEVALSYTRYEFDRVLAVAAAIGAGLCILGALLKKESALFGRCSFWLLLTLVAACTVSSVLKYGYIRNEYFDAGDAFSYFLGPKYFKELGYDVHYECAAAAQIETGSRLAQRGRDLRDNRMKLIRDLANPDARRACRNRFTEARWEEFKRDVDTFRSWHGREGWRKRFRDHGYNGTPVYQAIAGFFANAVELSHRNLVIFALANLWMLTVMFGFVIKAFGWRVGLLFSLYFWANVLERYLLGGAYLRYEWITALVIGLSFMKMNRYAAAGGFFAFAAAVKIFPVLLFAGIGATMIWDLVFKRKAKSEYLDLIRGAVATSAVLLAVSVLHGHGVRNWTEFLHQMDLNSGRFTVMRVGFIYNFLWPKEIWPTDPGMSWGPRLVSINEPLFLFITLSHLRWLFVGVVFAFLARHLRRMDDITRSVLVGFALFFMLFGTVRYYYSGLMGLPLMWHAASSRVDKGFWAYLLLISAGGFLAQEKTAFGFPCNTYYPLAFTAYYIAVIVVFELWKRRESRPAPRRDGTIA